jgi:prepilin-type N-terminal cleavage/methylation domain-containing protein
MKRQRAFTLIELLVVIAIIAVLMAILMPGLQRAKKQVQGIVCRNNLKNYGVAARMYLDDHEATFPRSFNWLFKNGGTSCEWHDATKDLNLHPELGGSLWPYLKDKDIHMCPTFKVVSMMMGCYRCNGTTIPLIPQYSYEMNSYLHGDAWGSVPTQWKKSIQNLRKESMVVNPSRVFFFSEENTWRIQGLSGAGINDTNLRSTPNRTTDCFATFHNPPGGDLNKGTANAVFVDMHVDVVSAYPEGNTFILSWPAGPPFPTGF